MRAHPSAGVALAALVACCSSGAGHPNGSGAAPAVTPLPAPVAPPPAPRAPAAGPGALVLVRHAQSEATARFVEVDAEPMLTSGTAPRLGQSFELAASPHPWNEQAFVVTGSQGGGDLALATRLADGTAALVHRTYGQPDVQSLALGTTRPTAVLVEGGVAYLGAGDRVGFVDLRASDLRFTAVHQRTLSERKAYDLLLVSGDWLVAVDDVVMPIWADSFALDARGWPTHREGWELPGVINGHYALGALLGQGGDGDLVLAAPYSIMDGHGHDLVTLPIHGHALGPMPEHFVLQNHGDPGAPPVLEEHVPRGRSGPVPSGPTLLAGTAFSEWTGLAVAGRDGPVAQLVFAAGARGLAVLPAAFDRTSHASLVDVGGHCLDVLARGDALFALVGTAPPDPYRPPPATPPPAPGPSKLVLLRAAAGVWHVAAAHGLDAPFTSFVH